MMQMMLMGYGGSGDATYSDDVFSTYLYDGNSGSQPINNGIDLAGEGGLVWLKSRSNQERYSLQDTERGENLLLDSSDTIGQSSITSVNAFNSNGFSLNSSNGIFNETGQNYVSWTFRKAPGFFDVVTWNGNDASGRSISHNLGSAPGMIITKLTSDSQSWVCYHRELGTGKYIMLDRTNAAVPNTSWITSVSASNFVTGSNHGLLNEDGKSYVAYLFAHDDASFGTAGNESIIKCGMVTTDGNENKIVDLGFEPQFVMFKRSDSSGSWLILDTMRGWDNSNNDKRLFADLDLNNEETTTPAGHGEVNSTGFRIYNLGANADVIYMAIRRPHKPPEVGTDVFHPSTSTGTRTKVVFGSGGWTSDAPFFPDAVISKDINNTFKPLFTSRLNPITLETDTTSIDDDIPISFDYKGIKEGNQHYSQSNSTYVDLFLKRAPGFFDVVHYNGSGSATTQNHNLEAVPELMIIKRTDTSGGNWVVYAEGIGASPAASYYLYLHDLANRGSSGNYFNDTAPTSSVFTIGGSNDVNNSSGTYLAYLFATKNGISKIGNYTSNGNARDVDCGFTGGARFVLIKKTNGNGHWYLFDTTRGITSGNDPYFYLNEDIAQQTGDDYIDPLNAGFALPASTPVNTNGSTYIFLAIA